jgi:hypothetical protein
VRMVSEAQSGILGVTGRGMTRIVTEVNGREQVLTVVADPKGSLRVRLRTEEASAGDGRAPGRVLSECVLTAPMVAGLVAWMGGLLPRLERQEPIEHRLSVPDGRGRYCRLQMTARMREVTTEEHGEPASQGPRRYEYGGWLRLELYGPGTREVEGTAAVPVADIPRFWTALRSSRRA